jgi:hypothetical protein
MAIGKTDIVNLFSPQLAAELKNKHGKNVLNDVADLLLQSPTALKNLELMISKGRASRIDFSNDPNRPASAGYDLDNATLVSLRKDILSQGAPAIALMIARESGIFRLNVPTTIKNPSISEAVKYRVLPEGVQTYSQVMPRWRWD